jgi:hypothetical protein
MTGHAPVAAVKNPAGQGVHVAAPNSGKHKNKIKEEIYQRKIIF